MAKPTISFTWADARRLFWKLCLVLFLTSVLWVLVYRWIDPPVTLHMLSKRSEPSPKTEKVEVIQYRFVELEDMSQQLPLAAIAAEDQLFITHSGFDFKAIKQAFQRNLSSKKTYGGSTISQQVAKNVFLWHGRSYLRKAVEMYFTFLIELLWGKERIMEVYLNIAEMGDHVFGVHAASQYFFKTTPDKLGRQQAALLAAVLPNPIKYSVKNPSGYTLRRRRNIVRNMNRLGGSDYIKKWMQ
ncbi:MULTISPECIES: monofunctional biosynthetic peptidoglycan transglycosylase [Rufibacter]|uniref:Biosynthetic peptidoglycan transglycosylase n=1 Tax=Rufibacter quisquiliarum TaxID=1549639 RepID=A0A839GLL1_9BACT|nr:MULTISPECIES: monofunctional biosynthetic peptidoglycan transglycosylase [Rufibacter]MBA9078713.1 monofunctional biosynthetic peptidoglycan transglycosylase [Rufibacter quisquiliarum]